MTKYFCCTEKRRAAVLASNLNGIDFLEVDETQRLLSVLMLKPLGATLTASNFMLEGGESVRTFRIQSVAVSGRRVTLQLDQPGDFSRYTLRLVDAANRQQPPAGFDQLLAAVEFSFKAGCPTDYDCRPEALACPPELSPEPDLDYLARDFNSYRQLMLDRISQLSPAWREQSLADLLHALVDVKAYVADYQSYQQDAVATEAYLHTARQRVSARRHARLLDYYMHDGCNARTWVCVAVDPAVPGPVTLPKGTQLFSRLPRVAARLRHGTPEYREALSQQPVVFETMHGAQLHAALNRVCFYTWGDDDCCLPRGATRATLLGALPMLRAGAVLLFEEVLGPETGFAADADLRQRHAVRLLEVTANRDNLTGKDVTEIRWHADDALPFALCLSSPAATEAAPQGDAAACLAAVSVARGNLVLADHGLTLAEPEDLGVVPEARTHFAVAHQPCEQHAPPAVPPRFRPRLRQRPLTQGSDAVLATFAFTTELETALNGGTAPPAFVRAIQQRHTLFESLTVTTRNAAEWLLANRQKQFLVRKEVQDGKDFFNIYEALPASRSLRTALAEALPQISLLSVEEGVTFRWQPRRDLLNSNAEDRSFVVEVENDGTARLRFGDDSFGRRPESGTRFQARYRLGNGVAGNLGAGALAHIVTDNSAIVSVVNPLPAQGGCEPETLEETQLAAPHAYRRQERAVTLEDYATVAERHPAVQRAVATMRWTGSWHTVFLTVDRLGGLPIDAAFETELLAYLNRFRMAGYDLEVNAPRFVPLELELDVCVKPDYFRHDVRRALSELLSARVLADGRRGLFHPDNFTFGQTVYLSRIYAAVSVLAGIASANITMLRRQGFAASNAVDSGKLTLGRLEIARLDNDPNHPDRGVLRLNLKGGK
jgi:hypothetical protein